MRVGPVFLEVVGSGIGLGLALTEVGNTGKGLEETHWKEISPELTVLPFRSKLFEANFLRGIGRRIRSGSIGHEGCKDGEGNAL